MAVESLTEPLLPRGRDDRSTAPADSIVSIAAATPSTAPGHRRAINVAAAATAKYPAFAVDRDAALDNASATAAVASASSPTTSWEDRPGNLPPVAVHRDDAALEGTFAADRDATPTTDTSASPPTTSWQDRRPDAGDAALEGPSASPPATPSPGRRANLLASHGPARGIGKGISPPASGADAPPLPASPASLSDALRRTGLPAAAAMSIERVRISPNRLSESVGDDSDGSSNNQVERIRLNRATRNSRDRSFRTPRGRRLYRRLGLRRRLMPVPQKDTWGKESFMYTCVLVLFVGLVAYLSTVLDGWSPYLRGIFIVIFGATTGLACIGAMALISETPDPSAQHFAHIVSRLTFIVGSLAFEAAVFYLLGEFGFIAWLFVAAATILGMTHIWRVGSPGSFAALVSCPGYVYSKVMGLFRRA